MKLTLANIKELKRKSDSPLTRHVCNYVIDRWGDYDDDPEEYDGRFAARYEDSHSTYDS